MSFIFPKKEQKEFKKWHLVVLLLIFASAFVYKVFFSGPRTAAIEIAGKTLKVLVADSPQLRYQGLSGRNDLGGADGMMFVFNEVGQHAMVMRGMKFSLDMVWLGGQGIVDIAPSIPLEIGREESALTTYIARAPSSVVLELPAGFAAKYGFKVGDSWKIIKYKIN